MTYFKQKIMAAAFGELHAAIAKLGDWAPGCGHAWLPNSEAAKLQEAATTVFVLGQREYALITRLVDEVEVLKAALERMKTLTITDGCEECSAVWQREYVPSAVRDALSAHQKRWEDLK